MEISPEQNGAFRCGYHCANSLRFDYVTYKNLNWSHQPPGLGPDTGRSIRAMEIRNSSALKLLIYVHVGTNFNGSRTSQRHRTYHSASELQVIAAEAKVKYH
eukprot:scaffold257449_cov18-Prasinocladus_malaysianus.AAC.1